MRRCIPANPKKKHNSQKKSQKPLTPPNSMLQSPQIRKHTGVSGAIWRSACEFRGGLVATLAFSCATRPSRFAAQPAGWAAFLFNAFNPPSLWEGAGGREPNYNHSTESGDSWAPAPCPLPKGGGLRKGRQKLLTIPAHLSKKQHRKRIPRRIRQFAPPIDYHNRQSPNAKWRGCFLKGEKQ